MSIAPVSVPIRVLVVDDDSLAVDMLTHALGDDGYALSTAHDALGALQLIQTHGADIIVLDWMMPDMDGLELCRRLRQHDEMGTTCILMVTAHTEMDRMVEAFNAGADDFISKPFHHAELRVRVRAMARIVGLQRRLAASILIAQRTALEQSLLNSPLSHAAATDVLTGLSNRHHVMTSLPLMVDLARRVQMPLACLEIDLDGFAQINQALGQAAGDDVLRAVGQRIKHSARAADLVARVGSDGFLLLSVVRDTAEANTLAQRLCQAVADGPITTGVGQASLTAHVGVACAAGELLDPLGLLHQADAALRRAKAAGPGAVSIADADPVATRV